ncbi:MAG: alanine racemase [Elusimicrobiota bacterium]
MPASVSPSRAFFRPTWAEISVAAFRHNLKTLARLVSPGARLLAVLKADGYGHGAAPLARAAAAEAGLPLWGFGVSSVEEGLALRREGVAQRVLILGSLYPFDSFEAALKGDLTPAVASRAAAREVARIAAGLGGRRVPVHVKVDTGMGRIGVSPETAGEVFEEIVRSPSLLLEGVFTHLAQADSAEKTREQLARFEKALAAARALGADPLAHAANSEATLLYPESHHRAVRPGLALYGLHAREDLAFMAALRPALEWKTRIVFLKTVPAGSPVSYGGTWRAARPSRLATLPVGYADGYRRALSNRAQVLVGGRRCAVVGRVTMDQIVVDVTDAPAAEVGSEAVLVGVQGSDRISVEEMARWADTVPYEIVCGITPRVPRVPADD